MTRALLLVVGLFAVSCGGDDEVDYGGYDGDPGDYCDTNQDCAGDLHCCDTNDCRGLCSDFCDGDEDCVSYMACRDGHCAVTCPAGDESLCPDGFDCDTDHMTCEVVN